MVSQNSETLEEKVIYRGVDGQLWNDLFLCGGESNGELRFNFIKIKEKEDLCSVSTKSV